MMDEPVDEGNDTGSAGEDGTPVVEGAVRGNDDGLPFVSSGDDLKEQVGGALVV